MMDVETLKRKLDASEDILLLDVRSAAEYVGEQGHVKGSVLIPVEELDKRVSEIQEFQEKTVMTICRTDRRSAKAAQILAKHGFADVHVVRNGMTAWNESNFDTG
ncbi:MAG: rhodanese-like domain-containing protein [Gammaproteobacteria bacterium]